MLPPITRLIEPIDGINIEFVAQCLGVDPKKYKYHSEKKRDDIADGNDMGQIQQAILTTETEKNLRARAIAYLKIKCPGCENVFEFPGIYQEKNQRNGVQGSQIS